MSEFSPSAAAASNRLVLLYCTECQRKYCRNANTDVTCSNCGDILVKKSTPVPIGKTVKNKKLEAIFYQR